MNTNITLTSLTNFGEYAVKEIPEETFFSLTAVVITRLFFKSVTNWLLPLPFVFWGTQLLIKSDFWHHNESLIALQKQIFYLKKEKNVPENLPLISATAIVALTLISKELALITASLAGICWMVYKSSVYVDDKKNSSATPL